MGSSVRPDPVADYLAAVKQPAASDPVSDYLNSLPPKKHDYHAEFKSGALAKRMQDANTRDAENAAETPPDYASQALGGIASLARDIPGAEALQAGARSLVSRLPNLHTGGGVAPTITPAQNPESYREALSDIHGAEASAPSVVRNYNRIAGGAVAASAVPGGPALSGARYGILSGLLQSDPDATLKDRLHSAAGRGLVGAVSSQLANTGTTALRGVFSKSSGAISGAMKSGMKAADEAAYGQAAAEGSAAQTIPPEVHQALTAPDIAPYADVVRNSRKFAGADEPTVLREAYKLMSERQGTLGTRVINATDHKAGSTLERDDIGLAKQQLLDAADHVMPSFRPAVEQHARLAGNRTAFQSMQDAAGRVMRGTTVAAKKLDKQSEEAVLEAIAKMKEEVAGAGLDGALSRLHDSFGFSANPLKLFGAGPAIGNSARVAPLVSALDKQIGRGASAAAPAVRHAVTGSAPSRLAELLRAARLQ